MTTIGETIEQLHQSLRDYIEATYHVSHPTLVRQRAQLLSEVGVIHQRPYLESTPRYKAGARLATLGLTEACLEVLTSVSNDPVLIHDPPYQHQSSAIRESLVNSKSLIVMTGTGSGKTECFLLPILGKLANEAKSGGRNFGSCSAVRAIVLYPMNALVNDQLGRLRTLFGDPRIVEKFTQWSGRPARFARYTSRTLYPGVRSVQKDQARLSPIGKYYVKVLETSLGPPSEEQHRALCLIEELKQRGKWPAKPDLLRWYYGEKRSLGGHWRDSKSGLYKRCVTLPLDPELLTRHEIQEAPPDLLVTNYSMLEYMLMRPLERPIFDKTRDWLEKNKGERLLLVIDEAHLYRGASGAEVALLIRRLRTRLGIPPERLQVICTSASFKDPEYAKRFGAELSGKEPTDFVSIKGDLLFREGVGEIKAKDAQQLSKINLQAFYSAETNDARLKEVDGFLQYREVKKPSTLNKALYDALVQFSPMTTLINATMTAAQPVDELGRLVFPSVEPTTAAQAVTALLALGSLARPELDQPGLLPCRVHSFYRGLAGLWACMDPSCTALEKANRGGPIGKLYSQPRDACECGARVLELYTCRSCGTAYARAYTNDLREPDLLWAEAGGAIRTHAGDTEVLEPLDLLLEAPVMHKDVEPAGYDLLTGRLNPKDVQSGRVREVFLRPARLATPDEETSPGCGLGQFRPCAVCGESATFGRSSVQDHQTKGDQPFQALISKQLQVQPPNVKPATRLAPLRGRKVLIFSDSRQTAARLAPNLQQSSMQDVLRPLIVSGFSQLRVLPVLATSLCLDDLFLAVLVAAKQLGVRLRPELKPSESFGAELLVSDAIDEGALRNSEAVLQLRRRVGTPPVSLLRAMMKCLHDRYYGLEALALASIAECAEFTERIAALPPLSAEAETDAEKLAIVRTWLRCWNRTGIWLDKMPPDWWHNEVGPHNGKFQPMSLYLGKKARSQFEKEWLPKLLSMFTQPIEGKYRLMGSNLTLNLDGGWSYCQACKTTQRPFAGKAVCCNCGQDTVKTIDPDTDTVFVARKGYYRASTVESLRTPPVMPLALIAAEHTAQLNTAQANDVYSKAEEHELLFQDVDLGLDDNQLERPAIDVLSCTTTMEVGIDIGTLSGVSLRNMPPGRANYQQRAGRAGRRANAVATVTAFGSADSHDEHYFSQPSLMIKGAVDDPLLTLNNKDIARRHVTAYLLQRYHHTRLPNIKPEEQPHLFAVLGSVADFRNSSRVLNRDDFERWLRSSESALQKEVDSWLPKQLAKEARTELLDGVVPATLAAIDQAIEINASNQEKPARPQTDNESPGGVTEECAEVQDEEDEEKPAKGLMVENLLDRLLYKGVLPRYAFPTDVATFYVFDREASSTFRPVFKFTPSQGLAVALSQYAPGKEVWIGNKLWTSGAIYSPIRSDLSKAWENRRYYFECSRCHYALTEVSTGTAKGQRRDCPACGGLSTLGPGTYWMRPPGFAHPVSKEEGTSLDDQPARSHATRAKLTAPAPSEADRWTSLNSRLRLYHTRPFLLVTNRGPRERGYSYCLKCGLVEPSVGTKNVTGGAHPKPYPDQREANCPGGLTTTGLVLGTDFITDVLLISLNVERPINLQPGSLSTDVALRTLSEALSKAACRSLELEANELQAEYRPALTQAGRQGTEAEIYIYDTLPGGAGFAPQVGALGLNLFRSALEILEQCPTGCDRSCYRCVRSYKNKFEHGLLDRHLGASLLRSLLTGSPPTIDEARVDRSTDQLFSDLQRLGLKDVRFVRNQVIEEPIENGKVIAPINVERSNGRSFVVGLHNPLTPGVAATEALRAFHEVRPMILIDELRVRLNLAAATREVLDRIS